MNGYFWHYQLRYGSHEGCLLWKKWRDCRHLASLTAIFCLRRPEDGFLRCVYAMDAFFSFLGALLSDTQLLQRQLCRMYAGDV